MKNRFITEFEPIRGLAALTVAVMHSFYVFSGDIAQSTALSHAKILFNGFAAVTVFFVLSGVVLGMALDRYTGSFFAKWRQFLILRIFRIYPMIIVVTIAICIYLLFFHEVTTDANATGWFNRYYREDLSWYRVMQNFLLVNVSLNPVGWTLMVEIAIAFIFPVLHRISRRSSPVVNLIILAVLIALAFAAGWFRSLPIGNHVYGMFCELVLPHAYKFYLGLLLPMYVTARFVDVVAAHAKVYFVCAIVALTSARNVIPQLGLNSALAILVESLAATCLLAPFCRDTSRGFGTWLLNARAIRWLGRVSYGFYLWHFIVLYAVASLMLHHLPGNLLALHPFEFSVMLAVFSIAVTGLLSELSYRHIEIKYMEYGRKFSHSLALRQGIATSG